MSRKTRSSYSEANIPGAPVNPIVALRELCKYTQEELARMIGVTSQTIRRAEQGTFNYPPASICEWYDYISTNTTLAVDYEIWRAQKRAALVSIAPKTDPLMFNSMDHPFKLFRAEVMRNFDAESNSLVGFCKLVCLEPKVVSNFEASYSETIPVEIKRMMIHLGYMYVKEFEQALKIRRAIWLNGMNNG